MRHTLFRLRRAARLHWARHGRGGPARIAGFSLRLLWLSLTIAVVFAVVSWRDVLPQPLASGWKQLGSAVEDGVGRALPVLARPFQPAAEHAYQLVVNSLPRPGPAGDRRSLYETARAALRAGLYRLIGYDPGHPASVFEAELVGYAVYVRSRTDATVDTASTQSAAGVTSPVVPSPSVPRGREPSLQIPAPPDRDGPPGTVPPPLPDDLLDRDEWLRDAAWGDGPLIAVFHTHTSEMYRRDDFAPADAHEYHRFGTVDTGIVRVGERLAATLRERYGIPVIHDTTLHDTPCHSCAYVESRKTVESLLRQYPSLKIIVDVHRDGAVDLSMVAAVGEDEAAQVALVVGRPANTSRHPRWQENDAFARRVAEIMNLRQPGLFRRIIYLNGVYNQDLHPRALLVEIGNYYDHEAYALRSAELLAAVLAEVLYEELHGGRALDGPADPVPAVITPN